MSLVVSGTFLRSAVMKARESGKSDRHVIQLLAEGPDLFQLLNIGDMSGERCSFAVGSSVVLPVTCKAYRESVQYTYWGGAVESGSSVVPEEVLKTVKRAVPDPGNGGDKGAGDGKVKSAF